MKRQEPEENPFTLETPDKRLTIIFGIVFALHILAFVGILLVKFGVL